MSVRSQSHSGRVLFLAVAAVILASGPGLAFTGALSSTAGGIAGTGNWIITGPTAIQWSVTESPEGWWHYSYEFSHPAGPTTLFVLETSTSFSETDLFNAAGDFGSYSVGTFAPGGDHPNMPGSIYGIRFASTVGYTTRIAFDSHRAPVWGDFYSRNGTAGRFGLNTAWNAGFLDIDPGLPPANGSLAHHILVPDTESFGAPGTPVPEPTSLLLLGVGLAIAGLATRRRDR